MKKDISTNHLIECSDVFADIANVNLMPEDCMIMAEDLEDVKTDSGYKDLEGELRRLFRDSFKRVKKFGCYIALIGFESQTGICNVMPVRDMGYNYVAYQDQIRRIVSKNREEGNDAYSKVLHDDQKLLPVLTVVLYFGKEKWERPLTLKDVLQIPEGQEEFWEKMIPDYKIRVIPMLHQPEEVRERYQSDYGVIADYLACYDQGKEKMMEKMRRNKKKLVHVEQTLDMLNAFSGDRRFERIKDIYLEMEENEKGEKNNMCDLLDAVEEEGVKKGISQGISQGIREGISQGIREGISQGISVGEEKRAREAARRMMKDGIPVSKIARYVDVEPKVLKEWLGE